jgi:ABC-type nickel/cobalt efflux system permease component RcnA
VIVRSRLLALVLLVVVVALAIPQSPFPQTGGSGAPEVYRGGVPPFIQEWSRELQSRIAALSRRVVSGEWTAALPALALSVLFGIVHIAGPGHGKVFAVSYFSGRPARIRDGLIYSAVSNLVDSVSAFLLVMLGYIVLRAVLPSFRTDGPRILELASYGLVVAFGVLHLLSHLRHRHHSRAGPETSGTMVAPEKAPWLLALSVGLVPCPVSTILLVYGVANNAMLLMVVMVAGVSLGGFLSMTAISLAVITSRAWLLERLRSDTARRVTVVLEFAASAAIILVGLLFLVAAL